MTLTLTQITSFINTMFVESGITTGYDATMIANDAGYHLYSMHSWRFREYGSDTLQASADDDGYVTLPADFGELLAIDVENTHGRVTWVTLDTILSARQNQTEVTSWNYLAGLNQPSPAAMDDPLPAKRIELYPDPPTTTGFEVWYRRTWAKLTNGTDVARIPGYCIPLYRELCRAFTHGAWKGQQNTLSPMLEEIEGGRVFAAAARADAEEQPDMGPSKHSAVMEAGGGILHAGPWEWGQLGTMTVT